MIVRIVSLILLAYALGFAVFGVTLGAPGKAGTTDAIVVLTGGSGRIERAVDLLDAGRAKRLLVAGADPSVTKPDLVRRLGARYRRVVRCCVDLGSESVDTRSNADEALRWLDRRGYRSVRLVTSDWHMRRARYEFSNRLGARFRIVPDAVRTRPNFATLFAEYNKYVLRRGAVLVGL